MSPQCLIQSVSSVTECITPKPQTHLGNEGHINMCCANSCEVGGGGGGGVTLQGWEATPFTLNCHEIRGWFRWKSKTQPDHHRPWRQSGESTVDDVTTRRTRQKVSRNMFLPGAYKPLPGFSSPRPDPATAALQHTHTHTLHVPLHVCTHACRLTHMHACLCIFTFLSDHAGKDVHKPHTHLNKHFHVHTLTHTHTILLPL